LIVTRLIPELNKAIGGYLPLDKVYSYNPVPAVLKKEKAKHVLGAQANLGLNMFRQQNM
jgi:N-acetyl-beta-hexosaminidase